MRILLITAVKKEAEAIASSAADDRTTIVVAGVGRTNAACATTESILQRGPFDAALSVGVAGALPSIKGDQSTFACEIGEPIVATHCVYAEEGLITPEGFRDMSGLGFPLAEGIVGNALPTDAGLLDRLAPIFRTARIATVATCSAMDGQARDIARRTGAIAEAMEGAAVVHAARRLSTPAGEVRVISNTTGDRSRQQWDLSRALGVLGETVREVVRRLRDA